MYIYIYTYIYIYARAAAAAIAIYGRLNYCRPNGLKGGAPETGKLTHGMAYKYRTRSEHTPCSLGGVGLRLQ